MIDENNWYTLLIYIFSNILKDVKLYNELILKRYMFTLHNILCV